MSLSTTSTTTYTLTKYSRAYPSQSTGSQENDSEWQHFTNPVIRLVLDLRKSARGELESYRVRVLWSLNAGKDMMEVDQQDVIFEDLDLLLFSDPPAQNGPHGLPLKAVYRNAVVGVRYLHIRNLSAGASPVYRRFQMNFQSTADATSVIEAIRHVCPCKANPPQAALTRAATMTLGQTTSIVRPSVPASINMPPPSLSASVATKQPLRPSVTMQVRPSSSVLAPTVSPGKMTISSPVAHNTQPVFQSSGPASTPTNDACTSMALSSASYTGCDTLWPPTSSEDLAPLSQSGPSTVSSTASLHIAQCPHPPIAASSAATTAHIQAAAVVETPTPAALTTPLSAPAPSGQGLGSDEPKKAGEISSMDVDPLPQICPLPPLPKSSELCDIPKPELEALIAEVVREEGFVRLVSYTAVSIRLGT
ncbi:uncharacterized protein PHACADRAFT_167950 [Phanerochaete carnosa HHB-10118-sp]|uniref:Uncharacterized protein n=1 Tax=Phanerochaete carnosa (strain HHB-10118-sp) TaxID=650164 RepID=K5WMG2_PHACS|nr:uncharacterized protein PHACADRAFT_167950 [Phanerochaete carnosa HHB-10118-sp]EKM60635.1 hypothetical protein PHACADRAFT_167950 [Phanerochaete carnosa HHB-10118-sp]